MPLLALFVFGAAVGSFLNVCVMRLPVGESVVSPASRCLSCRRAIAWFDNLPCLSFFILRGRCRNCGSKFSWQYPLVEAITGALFIFFYLKFGPTAKGLVLLVFSLALGVESLIDWKHEIIPDEISLGGMVIGLVLSTLIPSLQGAHGWLGGLARSLAGLLVGGLLLYACGTIAEYFLKKEAMGGGDVKLLAMIGAFLGVPGVLWTVFASSLLGSVVGIYQRVKHGKQRIPYGPFLGGAAFLYPFWGQDLLRGYAHYLGLHF